jgi:tetratricopeptide (TPR) repeat protein
MSQATKYLICVAVLALSAPVFAAEVARVFQAERGAIIFLETENERKIMIAGGAMSGGAATAGDCFVEANLSLKKYPDYYEGDFDSVHNEIIGIDQADVQGKGLGVYESVDQIRVGGAEVSGICAGGIDFSGVYREVKRGSASYERNFMYFMNLSHQNANYLLKNHEPNAAVEALRPFVDMYDEHWLAYDDGEKVIIPSINDYAFALQEVGEITAALSLLKVVINHQPDRAIAWLNIADAYWSVNDHNEARRCYRQYTRLMAAAGMDGKIPDRVSERLGWR